MQDDKCTLVTKLEFFKETNSYFNKYNYNSKDETGFVGLKNQGATCYMNSLLQTLFHVTSFKRALFKIPLETRSADSDRDSIALALQRVFYHLQYSNNSVSTRDLTHSFGWSSLDAFTQHDIQEFSRVLTDAIDSKMKNTPVEDTMNRLFRGRSMAYIKCKNVSYTSTRTEDFLDLSLNVKGFKNIYESFKNYVEEESLDGDNQYRAGRFGLQDATKGTTFVELPPVLQIQLKRFEYDYARNIMVKVNDYFEFPSVLSLNEFVSSQDDVRELERLAAKCAAEEPSDNVSSTSPEDGKNDSTEKDREEEENQQSPAVDNTYVLHSVLVHSGSVYGGHYYAFIRPTGAPDGQWFKFDDETVTKVEEKTAMNDNFGGDLSDQRERESENPAFRRFSITPQNRGIVKTANAYMLVYVRQSEADDLLKPLEEGEIPECLLEQFKQEQEEKARRKREQEEEAKRMDISILDERLLIDCEMGLELGDFHSKLQSRRELKEMTLDDLRTAIEEELGLEEGTAQFFAMYDRQNGTTRPNKFCNPSVPISQELQSKKNGPIFVRRKTEDDPRLSSDCFLLLFKYFDAHEKKLRYVGSRIFDKHAAISEVHDCLVEMMGFDPTTELLLFEEENVSDRRINSLSDMERSLDNAKLVCGDIICFQRAPSLNLRKKRSLVGQDYSDSSSTDIDQEAPISPKAMKVDDFLEDLFDRVYIRFCPAESDLDGVEEDWDDESKGRFTLELRRSNTYIRVARQLAHHLGDAAIADKIQLVGFNRFSPSVQKYRFNTDSTLAALLQRCNEKKLGLYYETLQYPLKVFEEYADLSIEWFDSPSQEPYTMNVLVRREGSRVQDLIAAVLRAKLSSDEAREFSYSMNHGRQHQQAFGHQEPRRIVRRPLRILAITECKTIDILDFFHPLDNVISPRYFRSLTLRAELTPEYELPGGQDFLAWVTFFSLDSRQNPHYHGHPFSIPIAYVSSFDFFI
jgi:ubiquitin carboxyl-terminal hydrolase 7